MLKNRKAEKNKEELRKLTLLPGNKLCMNCPVRGPMYAVIDFNIFVCTQCSAIHRSMQHKVKGISLSDFTDEEVAGLRVGGNERASLIWRAGYPYGVPREGDERAIRSNVTMCFVERRYFNASEHERLQNDQLHAGLPPVTGLPSGVTLVAPHHAHPSDSTLSASKVAAPGATQTLPTRSAEPTIHQGHVVTRQAAPPQERTVINPQPSKSEGTFDDFFAGSHVASNQPTTAGASLDFFGPSTSAPAPPKITKSNADDFFGDFGSGGQAAPAKSSLDNNHHYDDFFGGEVKPSVVQSSSIGSHPVALSKREGASKKDAFADLDPFSR